MTVARAAILIVLGLVAVGPSALGQPPKPDARNQQYKMGYQAGRRDERVDLCHRFESHSAIAEGLLGKARMGLVRAFCATRF
jgi:hypothetical protein